MITQESAEESKFLVGVNYWPRRKAMYWWRSFDPAEVLDEFGEIKNLQLHVVRIFLDWETFQPQPNRIDRNALANLEIVLDMAEKYTLKVIPTFFCGYMSGISLLPEWALDKKTKAYRHPTLTKGKLYNYSAKILFEDDLMLEAQKLQVRVITTFFSKHPAVYAWDLSNEVDNLAMPRNHQVAWNWLQTLVNEARNADLLHPITCGFHQENLEGEQITFRISDAGQILDFICMHGYPNYSKATTNPLHPDFVPFCNLLTQSLGRKRVLFEEFGIATTRPGEAPRYIELRESISGTSRPYLASEEEGADYYRRVLAGLHRVGALGALAWCFSDYDERLWERPPFDNCVHERMFGITRSDGTVKPAGEVLKEYSDEKVLSQPDLFDVETYYREPLTIFRTLWSSFQERQMYG